MCCVYMRESHLQMSALQCRQLFFHLADMAGCLGELGPLQVSLSQELLYVLLFLLQGFLQSRGPRDLPRVPRGSLCQLPKIKENDR